MTIDPQASVLRTWFRFLRLHRRITARAAQEFRELGLSIPQFDVLSTLSEQEGLSQQELAERLYVTKGNVSGLIDRMAAQKLVERRAIPGDRRSNALYLTPEGRALTEKGLALQRRLVGATLGGLEPGEVEALDVLLVAWRDRVRALSGPEA
ncbi:MarR family transcriptional regulator [Alsobacter sp. SYSU M60028]|uniref:MarR family transcriptional regulator n=1 Tax=Alsobacter ponti TaxID=2962936 RepID=A0ABT1LCP5_9HYPH|nr:MarR family transcriptional regulator [Alsobacter ponti]MCP8939285.1 MarR family transcriptional regulator [Alsobacter ponti]